MRPRGAYLDVGDRFATRMHVSEGRDESCLSDSLDRRRRTRHASRCVERRVAVSRLDQRQNGDARRVVPHGRRPRRAHIEVRVEETQKSDASRPCLTDAPSRRVPRRCRSLRDTNARERGSRRELPFRLSRSKAKDEARVAMRRATCGRLASRSAAERRRETRRASRTATSRRAHRGPRRRGRRRQTRQGRASRTRPRGAHLHVSARFATWRHVSEGRDGSWPFQTLPIEDERGGTRRDASSAVSPSRALRSDAKQAVEEGADATRVAFQTLSIEGEGRGTRRDASSAVWPSRALRPDVNRPRLTPPTFARAGWIARVPTGMLGGCG